MHPPERVGDAGGDDADDRVVGGGRFGTDVPYQTVWRARWGELRVVPVWSNLTSIGTVTAPTVDTRTGPGIEINHGPIGLAQPGDCWDGTTPNILRGDRIVVTEGTDTDEVTVDDIRFTGPAVSPASCG